MPRGTYAFTTGRVEAFSCAPGPAGWRYVSDRLDLACDAAFRPVRFALGGRVGGAARLEDGSAVLFWPEARDDGASVERAHHADTVLTDSPGSWVAAIRQAATPGEDLVRRMLTAVQLDVACVGRRALQCSRVATSWQSADEGSLLVEHWHVQLDGAPAAELHLTGDVLLFGRGLLAVDEEVELTQLASPPNPLR